MVTSEISTLRNFVDAASRNPATFSKNTRALSIVHENIEDFLIYNNFMQQVELGSMFKRDSIDCDTVLQITDSSTKFRKFTPNSSEHAQKQATFQSLDWSGCCIKIKIINQLNDTC